MVVVREGEVEATVVVSVHVMMMVMNSATLKVATAVVVVRGRRRDEFISFGEQLIQRLGEGRVRDLLVVVIEEMVGCRNRRCRCIIVIVARRPPGERT